MQPLQPLQRRVRTLPWWATLNPVRAGLLCLMLSLSLPLQALESAGSPNEIKSGETSGKKNRETNSVVADATSPDTETTPEPIPEPQNGAEPLAFPPLKRFQELKERPLFSKSRRPSATAAPTAGDEQQLRETWKLTGIVFNGDQSLVLFQERNGDRRLKLKQGMPLDDQWQLDEISADAVVVSSEVEKVRLELREPRELKPVKRVNGKQADSQTTGDSDKTLEKTAPAAKKPARQAPDTKAPSIKEPSTTAPSASAAQAPAAKHTNTARQNEL